MKLSEIIFAQPEWFSKKNRKFINDIRYRLLFGKKTKSPYLVRETIAFWAVNPIDENKKIKSMVAQEFKTIDDVKEWLKNN